MPKSKRAKVVHLTQVVKKTKEHKERLFDSIRQCIPNYQHIFVFSIENTRNKHVQELRQEMSDSRIFLGKTTLMSRALGRTAEEAEAPGLEQLSGQVHGSCGLLFTNRDPVSTGAYLASLRNVDFARAGTRAPRAFTLPAGPLLSTGGDVSAEHDAPMGHTIEPELRRLGVPARMVKGRIVLGEADGTGEGYVVCREGDTLNSRQTRLLKLFSVCMSEFTVKVRAFWTSSTGQVTVVDPDSIEDTG